MEKEKFDYNFLKLEKKERYRHVSYVGMVILFLIMSYLAEHSFFFLEQFSAFMPLLRNFFFTLAIIFLVLLIREVLESLILRLVSDDGNQYNLIRMVRLIGTILIITVAISFLFQKPYTTLAGLGIISLVLGFALQAPITSFIAWLYIVFRKPYQVGDRIQIEGHRGDVVEISYLDTIIKEISGDYLGNDRYSGRSLHFPNSIILRDKVINYSGEIGPFIWNEFAIQVSFSADLKFVESCLVDASHKDFKDKYPNNNMNGYESAVYYRINKYGWIEAVLSYPVEPTDTTGRRNRILEYAIPVLKSNPEKAQLRVP